MSENLVECYSGQTYAEHPRAIHWEGERLAVIEIEGRWLSPKGRHFRARVQDGRVFEILYDEGQDEWHVDLR